MGSRRWQMAISRFVLARAHARGHAQAKRRLLSEPAGVGWRVTGEVGLRVHVAAPSTRTRGCPVESMEVTEEALSAGVRGKSCCSDHTWCT